MNSQLHPSTQISVSKMVVAPSVLGAAMVDDLPIMLHFASLATGTNSIDDMGYPFFT
jgi:hypothetical protein